MNRCRRRRSSLSILTAFSMIAVSFIHAQQISHDVPLTQFQNSAALRQNNFQQLPQNFQASSQVLHRNGQRILTARQVSRHNLIRHRQRSLLIRTTTHQPSIAQLTRNVYRPTKHVSSASTSSITTSASSKTSNPKNNNSNSNSTNSQRPPRPVVANISRRQGFSRMPFPRQAAQRFGFGSPMRVARPPVRTIPGRRVGHQRQPSPVTLNRRPFPMMQPPLSPIPFGAIQAPTRRRIQAPVHAHPLRSTSNSIRVSNTTTTITTTTPPPTTTITTTTQLPASSTSVATRRPIRVQSVGVNLRRKPLIGTTNRLQHSRRIPTFNQSTTISTSSFGLTRQSSHHQPTHRVVTDRLQTQSFRLLSTSTPSTTQESLERINPSKRVDDIEAAILKAVIESSTPVSTLRARAHRFRSTTQRHRIPPRIDSIEEAVLRAVLESTPPTTLAEIDSTVTVPLPQTSFTSQESHSSHFTTTTFRTESPTFFPAFATRRPVNRRRPFILPTFRTTPISEETSTIPTTTATTPVTEPTTKTTEIVTKTVSSTVFEQPTFTTLSTTPLQQDDVENTTTTTTTTTIPTTSTSEDPTTTFTTTTTTTPSSPSTPESEFKTESESDSASQEVDVFQDISHKDPNNNNNSLQQIEQNIIAAFATSPSSPEPPAPPTSASTTSESLPTSTDPSSAGPPGSLPPSDDIVDELNDANDFLQVAQRLQLLKRLLH